MQHVLPDETCKEWQQCKLQYSSGKPRLLGTARGGAAKATQQQHLTKEVLQPARCPKLSMRLWS
jgi:hypothetical protein